MFYDIHLPTRSANGEETGSIAKDDPYRSPRSVVSHEYNLSRAGEPENLKNDGPFWVGSGQRTSMRPMDEMFDIHRSENEGVGAQSDGRPPYVWPNHVDPLALNKGKLRPQGGSVFFYEPDGNRGRRICRMERWVSRTLEVVDRDKQTLGPRKANSITGPTSPEQTRNPLLAALGKDFVLIAYSNVIYNAQGLVSHAGPSCFYYTPEAQVSWVGYESDKGQCLGKKPDPKQQGVIEVMFDDKGKGYGAIATRPRSWGPEDTLEDGAPPFNKVVPGWAQVWRFKYDGSVVQADVNDRTGLTYVGMDGGNFGARDDNVYNYLPKGSKSPYYYTTRNSNRRAYNFTELMTTDVLRHPETFYQYGRVRFTSFEGSIIERFEPGPGQIASRLWMEGDSGVARQEFFKNGKLVRAAAVDNLSTKEMGEYWAENWPAYKSQITVAPFGLVYLRVYDYDANGKESLIAIGWTDFPRDVWMEQHSGSKRAMLNDYKEKIARLIGRPTWTESEVPEELKYSFGTPDGKTRWADFKNFSKALGPFQGSGRDVIFPHGRRYTIRN